MLYLVAAVFTLAAWGIQTYMTAVRKSDKLNLFLPLLYAVTCLLFTIEAVNSRDTLYMVLNAVLFIFLVVTTVSLLTRKKTV